MIEPEKRLWAAVVLQAVRDAARPNPSNKSKSRGADIAARAQARAWLTAGSEDFQLVCNLAGVNATAVRSQALRMQAAGWPPIGGDA